MSKEYFGTCDVCPRRSGRNIEAQGGMYAERGWAVKHVKCNECGYEFEQHYTYSHQVIED